VNGKKRKNCTWIGKKGKDSGRVERLCERDDVTAACPSTCGLCCGDNADFEFKAMKKGKMQTCEWLAKKYDQRKENCKKIEVKSACQAACKNCSN